MVEATLKTLQEKHAKAAELQQRRADSKTRAQQLAIDIEFTDKRVANESLTNTALMKEVVLLRRQREVLRLVSPNYPGQKLMLSFPCSARNATNTKPT